MREYEVRSLANGIFDICVQYLPPKTWDSSIILKDKAEEQLHQAYFALENSYHKPLVEM